MYRLLTTSAPLQSQEQEKFGQARKLGLLDGARSARFAGCHHPEVELLKERNVLECK
jgi:hypothetical protein